MIQDLPDDRWILRSEIGWAFDALQELGLVFDALVFPLTLNICCVCCAAIQLSSP
jgi:hypothetical protein